MLPFDFWETEKRYLLAALVDHMTQAAIDGVRLVFGFDNELANRRAADWARQHTDDLLQLLGTTTQRVVGERIDEWIRRPESKIGDLVASLKEGLETSVTRASTIAVTEVTRAYAEGNKIAFQEANIAEWRWQTNNDEMVCPICGPLNRVVKPIGEIFGVFNGKPFTQPPAHPNCRCWVTPIVKAKQ